jgi:hypothetical protein
VEFTAGGGLDPGGAPEEEELSLAESLFEVRQLVACI